GVAVNIFVEGEHHLDKRILTIQKGLARVAFGAYEKDRDDELQIFPIGCNYFFGDAERDEAKIIVGDPLFVKDYWEQYQQNQAAAITKLCNDIRAALIRICYHIEDKNDDRLANQLLLLRRSNHPDTMLPIVHHHADHFFEEKAMLNGLNALPADEKEALKSNVDAYITALELSGLEDETFVQPQQGHISWVVFFILAAAPALVGYILSRPAHLLSSYVCKKAVKKREFYTSVLLGVRTLINFLIYVTFVLSGLISGMTWLIAMAFLMPILIWVFVFYRERFHHWRMARKAWSHPNREKIMLLRNAITLPAEAQ
ncbi:MAG: hypothetical protein JNJ57_14935, partial [Saprospiraceae bacterium]|nr:hypothetical protein [Saprospiraceae bacterium]